MDTTSSDAALLASMDKKLQVVRDRVRTVTGGYRSGFYLWGEGGTSKSYTVEQVLKEEGKSYKLTNCRVTAKGLFTLLRDFPDAIHVLEDAETMFKDENTFGVLRSALWGQAGADGRQERVVCWRTAKQPEEFVFTGGIIIIANCPLEDVPQLRALQTRIPCLQYQPTNEEVAAKMRSIAARGHRHEEHELSPEKCLEVAKAIVERSTKLNRNLDLRLLVNTFQDRIQYENKHSESHWLELLECGLKGRATPSKGGGVRAQTMDKELEVARRIANLPTRERLEAWKNETGKSRPVLYRRLADLAGAESQDSRLAPPTEVEGSGASLQDSVENRDNQQGSLSAGGETETRGACEPEFPATETYYAPSFTTFTVPVEFSPQTDVLTDGRGVLGAAAS